MKKYLFFASLALITGIGVASAPLHSLAFPTTTDTTSEWAKHHDALAEGHGEGHGGEHGGSMMEDNHHDGHGGGHHHGTMEIPAGQPIPAVSVAVREDSVKGWNLEVQLENFTLTPENVNLANRPGEGHAHIYINGEKITRLYSNWYYLGELPPGRHEITVSLNSNQHDTLAHNGQPIQSTAIVEVPNN